MGSSFLVIYPSSKLFSAPPMPSLVSLVSLLWQVFKNFNLSETKLKKSAETAAELLTTQLEIFSKLLPLPSVEALTNLDQVMKQPRKITNKPAHVLCILLAMIVCAVMFTSQLWDVATVDCTSEQGC